MAKSLLDELEIPEKPKSDLERKDPELQTAQAHDPVSCIDIVPAASEMQPRLYIRSRDKYMLDEWPREVIHIIGTYEFKKTADILKAQVKKALRQITTKEVPTKHADVWCISFDAKYYPAIERFVGRL